ncbi:MAG: translation elongation factor Ts [Verrucomicrobiota bacterium]|nr:translation elongation factor Ts [Verrucomicrobiota bacterium]
MSEISATMVADLRAKTGAGFVDCKKALVESNGNVDDAITILRKKGAASAVKKADRAASDGLIEYYIHTGGKIGVLLELNCETDFVAKTDGFKELAKDICMQIAAANPQFISRDQVNAEFLAKEREIAAASVQGKPADVIEKVVSGKMDKIYAVACLLEQQFVKSQDPKMIKDLLTENIAKMGENIVIRRFARFQIGE